MGDEKDRRIADRRAGNQADDGLAEEIEDRLGQRYFARTMATARTPKVNTAPVASLKADSLITVCATRSFTWTCLKTGTSVAGSVEAIAAPSRRATIGGRSSRIWAAAAVTRAVMITPGIAKATMVIHTPFRMANRSDAPPSNRR